ncbi:hypothetical protein [[Flexibacter] sp. ATCC 35208]|uniref:hypothetical protein n=1 Tax=[Flexibacter] sp. ATCC 35208 TaxID=1936242 RepID=UPI0009D633FB|nr:hypothetical protein [[Flexibacter] sp. ATCC 35208]OMP74534.1 hypothetical protein BW716_34865 [[Flexibacter] sp. ATCC 35208]
MIQYPFIWLFMSYVEKYKPSLVEITWIIVVGTAVLTIMVYLILKYVDTPLRAMLKRRRAAYQA